MENSILNSIKKSLGIAADYKEYDEDLILLINSEFSVLFQAGIGPSEEPVRITGEDETWDLFTGCTSDLEMVKEYLLYVIKPAFDPNSIPNSSMLDLYKQKADELLWRMNVADDPGWVINDEEQ